MESAKLPSWASGPCLMGIDEAGRGPVIGSMVYGAAVCPVSAADTLKDRGFADSKTLTDAKREEFFGDIMATCDIESAVDVNTAADISAQMLRSEKVSLNAIALDSTVRLVKQVLNRGFNVREVICDTVGDPDRWRESLERKFEFVKFTVCPKADALYPIVSAASIVAKVTRDREVRGYMEGKHSSMLSSYPLGSGYPSDPQTIAWLRNSVDPVFGYPDIVRFSWQTTVKLLEEQAVEVKWACDDSSDLGQKRLSFGQPAPTSASSGAGRHSYFQARQLESVASF